MINKNVTHTYSTSKTFAYVFTDEDDEASPTETGSEGTTGGKIRSSGSHIHLWQFLKKLLQSPSSHGSCIRWLDRNKGVFKIEDSVRVARLWGKRKNRPAMNYDKLSRSIRQYYKKGIMKKTERSQRLVYQFCHPYCLWEIVRFYVMSESRRKKRLYDRYFYTSFARRNFRILLIFLFHRASVCEFECRLPNVTGIKR